ncbi:MAG: PIG-L deacetylase family protein [Candidatus Rokuibacteriota bacterium]
MKSLSLAGMTRVLCLGAHCDDIEIGCGGTMLTLVAGHRDLDVRWVVFSSGVARKEEALASAERFLHGAGRSAVTIHDFRDGFFPYDGGAIKEQFEQLKHEVAPDLVLTHHRHDAHQDHRLVAELTWNTFRNQLILEYEIPKYDGDFGSPNLFVPLDESVGQEKIHHILESFKTQEAKHWFSRELFMSVLRIRGMEASAPTPYAEGFYCRKLVLGA